MAVSDREVEASLSLLGMMSEPEGQRDASLVLAVARGAAREGRRHARLSSLARDLTLDELRAHFDKPIVQVARELGICTTFLKKICRRCGIKRWPHRQIRSLARTIHMLRQLEAQADSAIDRDKYARQIAIVEAKQRAVFENPDDQGKIKRVKKLPAGPKALSSASSTSTSSSGYVDDDMLEDASLLAEAAVAISTSTLGVASPPPLGVQIPPLPAVIEPGNFTTPVHAATSPIPPVDLISPSHRKLAALSKGDPGQRLRTASIESLQDFQTEALKAEMPSSS